MSTFVLEIPQTTRFEFGKTIGGALVCTIGRNGKVWPHGFNGQSHRNDIELIIAAPEEGGYYFCQGAGNPTTDSPHTLDLTEGQRQAIEQILSPPHRDVLRAEINALVINEKTMTAALGAYKKWPSLPHCAKFQNDTSIYIVDCSGGKNERPSSFPFVISYDDIESKFKFTGEYRDQQGNVSTPMNSVWDCENLTRDMARGLYSLEQNADASRHYFYAVQAVKRIFNWEKVMHVPDKLYFPTSVLYGCENIFSCFDIDDAALIKHFQQIAAYEHRYSWILAVAQNRLVRNIIRLLSNNITLAESFKKGYFSSDHKGYRG